MAVPLLDLQAQYARIREEVDAVVAEVFASQRFVGGPKVEALEEAVAAYCDVPHAVGVASGTDALLLSLKAIGVGPGDEVITSPFTFFATAGTITNAGAKPVFVDIEADTYNIDPKQIEGAVTERTKAIIPVHLFGQCADMAPIMATAGKHDLHVIEDAAQAIGARYHGAPAGSLAHAGALSFFPSKNLGGAGDGGMVLANDAALAQTVRQLRNHGADGGYLHAIVGTNSRLDALQAAVLLVKLKHLDDWARERQENAAYYDRCLGGLGGITTPTVQAGHLHVYNQYVIRIPERDKARELLQSRGIGCSIYYPLPLHLQECFAHLGYSERDCPNAVRASREVLALPIYPELERAQQDEVVQAIRDHLSL